MPTTKSELPPIVRILGYAGLIPFIGLAFMVQLADSPNDLIALESLVAYGAVIVSFLGALHWGACFKTISTSTQNRWLDHSVWIWGIMPALIAWLAIHIFIPLALLLLAATLIVQRAIDQRTYAYYFENTQMANAFLRMRTHLTVVATVCLIWAGLTSLIRNY
ncbi:MAG: hypothetical protein RLY18_1334 [Pseudomonadota bacterium]|jgi:nitrate/nitrite-specific signal transduction histidine kinase